MTASPEIVLPQGYRLVSGEAYGQRYCSLVAPDGKIIENAYEQGAPSMFAFLSTFADRASVADRGVQAVPGEPVAVRDALKDALEFIEHYSHAWNGVSAKHPNTIWTNAHAALAAPASPSVAQAEPSERAASLVAPNGFWLAPRDPDEHMLISAGGFPYDCAFNDQLLLRFRNMRDSWLARASAVESQATLPSTPKAEGEGKQS